ncbi:MAG: nucleoside-diphosphate kinase [Simkaniaceae bacterium]
MKKFFIGLCAISTAFVGSILAGERTLSIIKPDAVQEGHIGEILSRLESDGFKIKAGKLRNLSEAEAAKFYEIHKEKPFYASLIQFMTSGPVFISVLEKENAVENYRALMGSTDPLKAEEGTLRYKFGKSIQSNAVHGSDSKENAEIEIRFFFPELSTPSQGDR